MGITIKQHNEKWKLFIENEEWQFDDRKSMENAIKVLLDIKERNGRIK